MKNPTPLNLEKLRFLIVDNDENMLRVVTLILRGFGIRNYRTASDVDEALQIMSLFKPDIIFCEWELAETTGVELVRQIRNNESSPSRLVTIIFLTAHTGFHEVTEARDAGITEFLAKPISPETLYRRIVSVIEYPRTFIEADGYTGPDRRRRNDPFKSEQARRNEDLLTENRNLSGEVFDEGTDEADGAQNKTPDESQLQDE